MVVKLFTLIDFLVLIVIIGTHFSWFNTPFLAIIAALYLIIKGFAFFGEILSILDLISGIYLILMLFNVKFAIVYFIIIFFLYKIFVGFAG
ncbi:hypothetical protein K8R47_00215 [archaeon]|nr:hypothetical protein [archaeon]